MLAPTDGSWPPVAVAETFVWHRIFPMQSSHVIEFRGVFAGAAVMASSRFRFIAVDPRCEDLDGSEWATLADIRRVVGHLLSTGRLPQRVVGVAA